MSDIIKENCIALIAHNHAFQTQENIDKLYSSLKGNFKRDWFVKHAYFCLPLVMGNQHGFVLKSIHDIEVEWFGGDSPNDVKVTYLDPEDFEKNKIIQSISSHFGMGTITIQTTFSLRTPDGINLMTINPPNSFIDGLYHMTGVIETDNLRRDFTYNIRITRPNHKIKISKGDIIGCVIPYPRHFIDHFEIKNGADILTYDQLDAEMKCGEAHGNERGNLDKYKKNGNGRRYHNGEDVYGNKFKDHQTHLDE